MRNLYYEQLEKECDPNLLHLHLTTYEVQMLRYAIARNSSLIGLPTRDGLIRIFDDFLLNHLEANIFEEFPYEHKKEGD